MISREQIRITPFTRVTDILEQWFSINCSQHPEIEGTAISTFLWIFDEREKILTKIMQEDMEKKQNFMLLVVSISVDHENAKQVLKILSSVESSEKARNYVENKYFSTEIEEK